MINTKSPRLRRISLSVVALAAIALMLTACDFGGGGDAQSASQAVTNTYTQAAEKAVPYPLHQMETGGWLERTELNTHLLRQNDKNALRYIVLMTQQGQIVAQYPIKGMVFDPNSQLTNDQQQSACTGGGSGACAVTLDTAGDNGTWGPEAGAAAFFTTSNVEIQIPASMIWVESDSPLALTSKPLINYNVNERPSTTAGGDPTASKPGGK